MRHLAAVERMALASVDNGNPEMRALSREVLDGLYAEAVFYANRNAPVGIEAPEPVEVFRSLLSTIQPAALTHDDRAAMLGLVEAAFDAVERLAGGAEGTVR